MRPGSLSLLLALSGCSQVFGLDSPARMDAAGIDADLTDAVPDARATIQVLHVPTNDWAAGTTAFEISTTIDTTNLTIDGAAPPSGVVFDTYSQAGGPELAVLHVGSLTVKGATVTVNGTRPLVVIASGPITVTSTLSGAARRDVAGVGGNATGAGPGTGGPGTQAGTFGNSGGSGGGFASTGGSGGSGGTGNGCSTAVAPTVAGGAMYGDATLSVLVGGSGGGNAFVTNCGANTGGAGGGAIQLSSATSITISGAIDVGGGGGGGGKQCSGGGFNVSAGSGGGSGGAIVLQAPQITGSGVIAANGGAGGSGAGDPNGDAAAPFSDGIAGADGQASATPAAPGTKVGKWSAAAGAGAAAMVLPGDGLPDTDCDGNGGGGGGSVGRIVIATPPNSSHSLSGVISPPATTTSY